MPYPAWMRETEARERLARFWQRQPLDRPCLGFTATIARTAEIGPMPLAGLPAKERELEPTYQTWRVQRSWRDSIAVAEMCPMMGVDWGANLVTLPVYAGADYSLSEAERTAWIQPCPDLLDWPIPVFDERHPLVRRLDACYDAACTAAAGRLLINPPLMLDGLSTLSEMLGPETFCLAVIERPEDLRRWAAALTDVYLALYERYYRRIGAGEAVCFGGPLNPFGRTEAPQCDCAVMLSPAQFDRLVLSDISRIISAFDGCLYHLDGVEQLRFLDQLAAIPGLTGIQWNPAHDHGRPSRHLDKLARIRERNLNLMINCQDLDEALTVVRRLGPSGLYLTLPRARDLAAAEVALTAIEAASHEVRIYS